MDFSLSTTHRILSLRFLQSTVNSPKLPSVLPSTLTFKFVDKKLRPAVVVVVARAGFSHCEPSSSSSSLNTPLEPRSSAGKFLSSVFQNQKQPFHVAVADELRILADDRNAAVSRMYLSSRSDEAFLHRRIAELKEYECQIAVEEVMYMLILYKFCEIRVPLVPKLSRCIYNGRLEIGPLKDWELESIHSFEVLEMIREHVCTITRLRANCSVTDSWTTTKIQRLQFGRVFAASILYGYFLKSAASRYLLEQCLSMRHHGFQLRHWTTSQCPESLLHRLKNLVFGHVSNIQYVPSGQGSSKQNRERESLRCYLMGFDTETL